MEINQYLTEAVEDHSIDILRFWSSRVQAYPALLSMARCFLAIPATSTPTEQIVSKLKAILGPQRASLDANSIEQLLCLKEWYRVFGTISSEALDNSQSSAHTIDLEKD